MWRLRLTCVLAITRLIELDHDIARHPEVRHQPVAGVGDAVGELHAAFLQFGFEIERLANALRLVKHARIMARKTRARQFENLKDVATLGSFPGEQTLDLAEHAVMGVVIVLA